jgi:glycine/D-amino acid oxidase-like deaminating enzyme
VFAQVHPFKLTNALLGAAADLVDSLVRCAVVTGVATEAGRVVGVNLDSGDMIPADAVVLAMGPWTGQVSRWLTSLELPITGDPVHSVVLKPEAQITAHMLFTRYQTGTKNTDPEVSHALDVTMVIILNS